MWSEPGYHCRFWIAYVGIIWGVGGVGGGVGGGGELRPFLEDITIAKISFTSFCLYGERKQSISFVYNHWKYCHPVTKSCVYVLCNIFVKCGANLKNLLLMDVWGYTKMMLIFIVNSYCPEQNEWYFVDSIYENYFVLLRASLTIS